MFCFFLMILRPPRSTLTDTLFPYTTLFRAGRSRDAVAAGIPCLALFPYTQADRRSEDGGEALNPDNLMCRATAAIKQALGDDIGILTDVALDPYTSHGQIGREHG